MTAIRNLAMAEGIIVLATIHQPSHETLSQFTNVMFLANGQTCFSGRVDELDGFFERWGHPIPRFVKKTSSLSFLTLMKLKISPSDHAMNFLNSDFSSSTDAAKEMREFYLSSTFTPSTMPLQDTNLLANPGQLGDRNNIVTSILKKTLVLCERSIMNYSRNLLAYGVRVGMYAGALSHIYILFL
jgi:hypothetical protein